MTDAILHWNQIALDVTKADFTTADTATNPSPEQGGPTRTSRALAIVHLAMYDAYIAIVGGTTHLAYVAGETPGTVAPVAAQSAVGAAAALTLIALFPRQKDSILREHAAFTAILPWHDPDIANGLKWGTLVAAKMLASREKDGSDAADSFYVPSNEPGRHRPDPMDPAQGFLGPRWGLVTPFGITNLTTVVPGTPPPALGTPAYATDYNEVLRMGSSQGSTRSADQTAIGLFWAYDGARNIGVPPRLYNQVVRAIAAAHGTTEAKNATLFAMINVAMADAGIQAWHEKYMYNVWRPVVGVREADAGWGPTALGDGNVGNIGDPFWVPLGAPKTNQPGRMATTPNFPAYPSGHATFGTAAIRVAALFLGLPDSFPFTFVSDELDGVATGATGVRTRNARPLTITSALQENLESRVFLGVHWKFDCVEGEKNGNAIATRIAAKFPDRG